MRKTISGPEKLLSIRDVLRVIVGYSGMLSKRLSPPMTIHNADIRVDGESVHTADVDLPKVCYQLSCLAELYGVEITVSHECYNGKKPPVWSSKTPALYLGWCVVNGKEVEGGAYISCALPWFEEHAKRQRRQWMLDHGLAKRTPKEWLEDVLVWKVRKFYQTAKSGFHTFRR